MSVMGILRQSSSQRFDGFSLIGESPRLARSTFRSRPSDASKFQGRERHRGNTLRLPTKTCSVLQRDRSNNQCVPTFFLCTSKPRRRKKRISRVSSKYSASTNQAWITVPFYRQPL